MVQAECLCCPFVLQAEHNGHYQRYFLAEIAAFYVTMSVSELVGWLVGISVCLKKVSTIVIIYKTGHKAYTMYRI